MLIFPYSRLSFLSIVLLSGDTFRKPQKKGKSDKLPSSSQITSAPRMTYNPFSSSSSSSSCTTSFRSSSTTSSTQQSRPKPSPGSKKRSVILNMYVCFEICNISSKEKCSHYSILVECLYNKYSVNK